MSPFEPAAERARWRIVFDLFHTAPTGTVVTYKDIGDALDLDADADRHAIQMAVRRAGIESEQKDLRAIDAVPNVGYRIVQPSEHAVLARRHQQRSNRALRRGHSKVVNVDLSGMDPEMRHAFEVMAVAFAMQQDFNRRMDIRQKRLERAVSSISEGTARSAEEVAELRERLERLEQRRADGQ